MSGRLVLVIGGSGSGKSAYAEKCLLAQAGVNRITSPAHMSDAFPGEAHDGEYPLRRYVRVVDVENNF